MHKLIKEYDLNQEDIFRYSLIEELDDYYLVATYKNYQVIINKYPKIQCYLGVEYYQVIEYFK